MKSFSFSLFFFARNVKFHHSFQKHRRHIPLSPAISYWLVHFRQQIKLKIFTSYKKMNVKCVALFQSNWWIPVNIYIYIIFLAKFLKWVDPSSLPCPFLVSQLVVVGQGEAYQITNTQINSLHHAISPKKVVKRWRENREIMKREKIIKRELEMIDRNLDGEHLNP